MLGFPHPDVSLKRLEVAMRWHEVSGGTYTCEEIKTGLRAAGCQHVRLIREEDQMMGLVEA